MNTTPEEKIISILKKKQRRELIKRKLELLDMLFNIGETKTNK